MTFWLEVAAGIALNAWVCFRMERDVSRWRKGKP